MKYWLDTVLELILIAASLFILWRRQRLINAMEAAMHGVCIVVVLTPIVLFAALHR